MSSPQPRRYGRAWAIGLGVGALAAGLVATAVVGVSTVAGALTPRVATTPQGVTVTAGDRSATVIVPAGWAVSTPWNDSTSMSLRSPDGVMQVRFVLTAPTDADAAATELASGPLTDEVSERDGSGRDLVHARIDDGTAVAGYLADDDTAVAFLSSAPAAYDLELAQLLAGIRMPA